MILIMREDNNWKFEWLSKAVRKFFYNCRVNLNWYDASPRTKKLILFMMMKTHSPCVLTAGGMFVLCMETYATVR